MNIKIPLSKPTITEEMKDAVLKVLDSSRFVKGPVLEKFESEFSKYCGAKYGVGVSSGTAAIYLALRALDIKSGDEVIVPSLSFIASASPILMVGATPKFVDVDESYCIDINDLKKKISGKTKAIICVHLYGQMCNMDEIMALKEKYGFVLIEDCAQAHGAEFRGKKAGSFGDISAFSFFPSKNMTVCGDGGMAITSDSGLYEKLKMLRDHGRTDKYLHHILSMNFRMSEISAAIGMEQLKHLDEWDAKRREIAKIYNQLLSGKIEKPREFEHRKHVYHLYVIRAKNREELKEYLLKNEIASDVHYPVPIHLQPIFSKYSAPLKNTERFAKEILSLPIYPGLEKKEIEEVCEKVNLYFESEK
ncbi:Aspartate aminotransferase [uncultured archaeon]|nr:Aspartate aminotransferase [uncultured archaeon]